MTLPRATDEFVAYDLGLTLHSMGKCGEVVPADMDSPERKLGAGDVPSMLPCEQSSALGGNSTPPPPKACDPRSSNKKIYTMKFFCIKRLTAPEHIDGCMTTFLSNESQIYQ